MNVIDHSAKGATISLGQRELLLVMALVQEGRESFECNTETGKALDDFFSSANVLVEEARRQIVQQTMLHQKISLVATSESELKKSGPHR
jgi:hypothetical protein